MKNPNEKYDDMIHLPHHVSKTRVQMSHGDRAAQFAPFAAVVGHQAAIRETERLTEEKTDLDEMEKALINQELQSIEAQLPNPVSVKITYFEPDLAKSGGRYIRIEGQVKKIDLYQKVLVLMDGTSLSIEALRQVSVISD